MYITTCIQPQILANQSLFNNAFLIEMTKIASVDQQAENNKNKTKARNNWQFDKANVLVEKKDIRKVKDIAFKALLDFVYIEANQHSSKWISSKVMLLKVEQTYILLKNPLTNGCFKQLQVENIIKIIDGLCKSMSICLLLNIQIIKVLNPQLFSREGLLLMILTPDFH